MIKIGIIGVGRISNGHIGALKSIESAKITAICDVNLDNLKTVGDSLNIPEEYRFTDYNELVNCDNVDAVEICTPNYLHVRMALAAVKAGKHVEVEKPLGLSLSDGMDELAREIKKSGVVNMMDFSYRFKDAVRYAKKLIERGMLGTILNVNIQYLQSGAFIPNRRLEWRFVKEYAGSGALADLGVHLVDMTRFLLGEFKSVCAVQNTAVKERMNLENNDYSPVRVDDITSFVAKLESGALANFLVTKCAIGESNTIVYEIYGTEGVIKFNLNNPTELSVCIGETDRETNSIHTVTVPKEYSLGEEECFIRAIEGEQLPYFPDISEGIKAQRVIDAILESAQKEQMITL